MKSVWTQKLSMQKLNTVILLACLINFITCRSIVKTKSGLIQGVPAQSDNVEAFLGIPFAEPPIGDLRFRKPVPKEPWTEIYEASSLPPSCPQFAYNKEYAFYPDMSNMSEDCLYLNIWKLKSKPSGGLRPVIIYIHYGAFLVGSSNQRQLDGSHLARQADIVVVTFNYRLGCLGFLVTNTDEVSGNMGLYDQVMAMKWVKENAQSFDGDPDNIVLMGTSAGAVSVSVHIISPLSQNLFRRAILMSGTIFNPFWLDGNKVFKSSEEVASIVGCTNETLTLKSDPRSVIECLKRKPMEGLIDAQARLMKFNARVFFPNVGDQILPEDAITAYKEGKFRRNIDVMFGINKDEGTLFLVTAAPEFLGVFGELPFKLTKNRATHFIKLGHTLAGMKESPERIRFYLDRVKNGTSVEYIKTIADFHGDFIITCSTVFAADYLSMKGNRVYFYKFGSRTTSSPMADWIGTTHGEDIQYVFGNNFSGNFTVEETETSNRLIARISAFAYTGDPNVPGQLPWMQYSDNYPLYLDINQHEEGIRVKPCNRCEVWRDQFHV